MSHALIRPIISVLGVLFVFAGRCWRRAAGTLVASQFRQAGAGVRVDPGGTYSYDHVVIGRGTNLGIRPTLIAGVANIIIGQRVMFGPEVMIVAGGHVIDQVGKFMADVHVKTGQDLGVRIDDDCWIGARAIVMKGVDVGRGSIVGAGTILTKSVAPYSIVAGTPGRAIAYRFSIDEVLIHEAQIYPAAERLRQDELTHLAESPSLRPPRTWAV